MTEAAYRRAPPAASELATRQRKSAQHIALFDVDAENNDPSATAPTSAQRGDAIPSVIAASIG